MYAVILNVLVVGKKRKIEVPFLKDFVIASEYDGNEKRYKYLYPNMSRQRGTFLSLIDEVEIFSESSKFCNWDDTVDPSEIDFPLGVENEKTREDLQPLIIYDQYKDEFKQILEYLLDQSPKDTIYFLPRKQGHYDEVICGTFKLDKFFRLLEQKKILTNVVYIITKYDVYDDEYPIGYNRADYEFED